MKWRVGANGFEPSASDFYLDVVTQNRSSTRLRYAPLRTWGRRVEDTPQPAHANEYRGQRAELSLHVAPSFAGNRRISSISGEARGRVPRVEYDSSSLIIMVYKPHYSIQLSICLNNCIFYFFKSSEKLPRRWHLGTTADILTEPVSATL